MKDLVCSTAFNPSWQCVACCPYIGKSYDESVDVFSYGIVLCEVCCYMCTLLTSCRVTQLAISYQLPVLIPLSRVM